MPFFRQLSAAFLSWVRMTKELFLAMGSSFDGAHRVLNWTTLRLFWAPISLAISLRLSVWGLISSMWTLWITMLNLGWRITSPSYASVQSTCRRRAASSSVSHVNRISLLFRIRKPPILIGGPVVALLATCWRVAVICL